MKELKLKLLESVVVTVVSVDVPLLQSKTEAAATVFMFYDLDVGYSNVYRNASPLKTIPEGNVLPR